MNQKYRAHYDLERIKALLQEGRYHPTITAVKTADSIGFSETQIIEVLLELGPADFYKSMTSNFNHRIWQDVYKKKCKEINLYIKFKVNETDENLVVILSFKEDEG